MYVVLESKPSAAGEPGIPASAIRLYPNPGRGFFKLQVPEAYHSAGIQYVELTGTDGRRLSRFKFEVGKKYETDLPAGVYWVNLLKGQTILSSKKMVIR
jgi:hypothetical protein